MRTVLRAAVLSLGLSCPGILLAASPSVEALREVLGKEIIGPRQAHADVRAFVEERLPAPPQARSAEEWEATTKTLREKALERVVFRGVAAQWRDAACRVEELETIPGGPGYKIKKIRYEAFPGMWIPALLYEPEGLVEGRKVPVVLNVNGHDGNGKAADYKQVRCINLAKRGILALNVEWFGMGQFRTPEFDHGLINAIDLTGTSGIATHFLSMRRGIDVLLAHPSADPERVGVTGVSGGGWQSIFISGLDPRVTLSAPVAGYSGFATRTRYASDLGDSEQTPCDMATVLDYTHLTAMRAPRPTLLIFNEKDNCCFAAPHALPPLWETSAPIYQLFGVPGNLRSHINYDPGDHNYLRDNREAFYQAVADFWTRPGEAVRNPKEIAAEAEVKTAEELNVPLPEDNLSLKKLAVGLARDLPHDGEIPTEPEALKAWQDRKREALRAVVRPEGGEVTDQIAEESNLDGVKVVRRTLRVASTWSVPAVTIAPEAPTSAVLILADGGRPAASEAVARALSEGNQVLVMDPWYFGEAKVFERDYLWGLMVGTVGERPIGVQAGQVAAVSKWWSKATGMPVQVSAIGPRASLIATVAAAVDPEAIDGLTLQNPLNSLKDVLAEGRPYIQSPEVFCFGLLEVVDIPQLRALVAPREVTVAGE